MKGLIVISCLECRFLTDIQAISINPNGITSVAKCKLFNLQILNLHVDDCTGKMLKEQTNERHTTNTEPILPS